MLYAFQAVLLMLGFFHSTSFYYHSLKIVLFFVNLPFLILNNCFLFFSVNQVSLDYIGLVKSYIHGEFVNAFECLGGKGCKFFEI